MAAHRPRTSSPLFGHQQRQAVWQDRSSLFLPLVPSLHPFPHYEQHRERTSTTARKGCRRYRIYPCFPRHFCLTSEPGAADARPPLTLNAKFFPLFVREGMVRDPFVRAVAARPRPHRSGHVKILGRRTSRWVVSLPLQPVIPQERTQPGRSLGIASCLLSLWTNPWRPLRN